MAAKLPGSVSFYPDEMARIEDAELMIRGIQPSELKHMSLQQVYDFLEISGAQDALKNGKMPGQK